MQSRWPLRTWGTRLAREDEPSERPRLSSMDMTRALFLRSRSPRRRFSCLWPTRSVVLFRYVTPRLLFWRGFGAVRYLRTFPLGTYPLPPHGSHGDSPSSCLPTRPVAL